MATSEYKWDDDEFDYTFFQEVDKLEELALSLTQKPHPPKPSSSASCNPISAVSCDNFSYSPPRELSQRFLPPNRSKDIHSSVNAPFPQPHVAQEQLEIQKLKNELSLASKQLSDLKQECSELRKERDKKRQLNSTNSYREASAWNSEAPTEDHARSGISLQCENFTGHVTTHVTAVEQKSIGIQTDKGDESSIASTSGVTSAYFGNPELRSIWCSGHYNRSRRNFVAKLLETCADDFCFLFRFLSPNMTSKVEIEHLSLAAFPKNIQGLHSGETAKISQLYSVLTKLSSNVVSVAALVDILLHLCSLENVLVIHRSLHVLRVSLELLLCLDNHHTIRDNIKVEKCHSGSLAAHNHDSAVRKDDSAHDGSEASISGSLYTTPCKIMGSAESIPLLCQVDWLLVFQSICQTALRKTEENVRMEALSVMKAILMTTDAYSERERFGATFVFEAVALLLKKQAGFLCRKETAYLLYLLLNCPKILTTFCSSCQVAEDHAKFSNHRVKSPAFQTSSDILEGLAECIVGCERGIEELALCRNALIVLAFLASSGTLGLEIFLFHRLPKRTNFMGLILQLLVSEANVDAFESCPVPEVSQERTLVVREALILLNRLASQPAYSATVMQVMTSSRDMLSLGIEVATILSKKSNMLLKSDTRQMRESEVLDLARVFKKRVYSFLGESYSC